MTIIRCGWCSDDPLYQHYHDHEWGKVQKSAPYLFEMICLEGQQAGLSWITVLRKRACYRQHFFQHPIAQIAQLSDDDIELKLQDSGLIRHRAKLIAIRDNAQAWQALEQAGIDPVTWLWDFVDQQSQHHRVENYRTAPAHTEISLKMSKALKKKGFKFMGPTTCYAFMQAVGMVDDHENHCQFKAVLPFQSDSL